MTDDYGRLANIVEELNQIRDTYWAIGVIKDFLEVREAIDDGFEVVKCNHDEDDKDWFDVKIEYRTASAWRFSMWLDVHRTSYGWDVQPNNTIKSRIERGDTLEMMVITDYELWNRITEDVEDYLNDYLNEE